MPETTVQLESPRAAQAIYANDPALLKTAEEALGVCFTQRDAWFRVEGTSEEAVQRAVNITQVDLPSHKRSGLIEIERILHDVPGVAFCHLDETDVVRRPLVQKIIRAFQERRHLTH